MEMEASRVKAIRGVQWTVAGAIAGAAGWSLGGPGSSFEVRTVLAATLAAVALGLLRGTLWGAAVGAAASAAGAALGYGFGARLATPLLAWPAAGLALGLVWAVAAGRTRARVGALIGGPLLGLVGFVAGAVVVALLGFSLNDAQLLAQLLTGGAAGFGVAIVCGFGALSIWLDRPPNRRPGA
jgi:hypothetical protein